MQPLQRAAVRSARVARTQIQRRYASHGAGDAHNTSSGSESFGPGFFVAVAGVPLAFLGLNYATSGDKEPYFTRLITNTYNKYANTWADRNAVHTEMIEQAAADRVLFLNEASNAVRHVDLRFPEIFNVSSPWNVPAGQGGANLDHLIAKYEKEAFEQNERKLQEVRENRVPREQPLGDFPKRTPAAADSG
ncbi:hypothetical protein Q7P37_005812 [Cladosporium fusiforme]